MQWLINFAFLALDCSQPIVHALVTSLLPLTELDIAIDAIDSFMAKEINKEYREPDPENVLDPQCVQLDPKRCAWIMKGGDRSFFIKHLGRTAIEIEYEDGHYIIHTYNNTPGFYPWDRRITLRRAHWVSQIKSALELFYTL